MITIEQWRSAIGKKKLRNQLSDSSFLTDFKLTFLFVLFLVSLVLKLNIGLIIFLKLLTAGDVELNPGPTYNIFTLVKASFHQGNPMFGASEGMQCACNALVGYAGQKLKM